MRIDPKPIIKMVAVLATVVGIGFILAFLAGVFREKVQPPETTATQAKIEGEVIEVLSQKRELTETAVGTIRPVHETNVASRLLSRVVEVNVTAGQTVKKGDVLVRLDDADLKSRLLQTEAAIQSASSNFERAQADFSRAEQLRGLNSVSQAELDQARANILAATSDLERLKQSRNEADIILSFSVITAPMDGMVIDKKVDVGDTVSPGTVLLTIYDPIRMQMIVSVRESLALSLKVGQDVTAKLESLDQQCPATISEIVPEAQAASRSFLVKVSGPCPPGAYTGMFGRVWLPVGEETVVTIPQTAVTKVGQLTLVNKVVDGRVERRSVLVGRTFEDNQVEVLSGLQPGDKVVRSQAQGS